MSNYTLFSTSQANAKRLLHESVIELKSVLTQSGGFDKEIAQRCFRNEAFTPQDENHFQNTAGRLQAAMSNKESKFYKFMQTMLGLDSISTVDLRSEHSGDIGVNAGQKMSFAIESAVNAMLVGAVPQHYMGGMPATPYGVLQDGTMVVRGFADNVNAAKFKTESFNPITNDDQIIFSAILSAAAAMGTPMLDLFFPPIAVSGGQNAAKLEICIPQAYVPTNRMVDGSEYVIQRTNIFKAMIDPSFTEPNSTDIVVWADPAGGSHDAFLVPAAVVPNFNVKVNGIDVPSRPIAAKLGKPVDLIALSNYQPLIANNILDYTDSLDQSGITLGKAWIKVTTYTGPVTARVLNHQAVVAAEIGTAPGALFVPVGTGDAHTYIANSDVTIALNRKTQFVNALIGGSTLNTIIDDICTIVGVPVTSDISLFGKNKVSGDITVDKGSFSWMSDERDLINWVDADGVIKPLPATLTAPVTNRLVTMEIIGLIPNARRTNSNFRDNGTMIDSNIKYNFLFPVTIQPPLTSISAITMENTSPLESLIGVANARQEGRAWKELLTTRDLIKNGTIAPLQQHVVGAAYVKPTYVPRNLDVTALVVTMASAGSLDNLRGAITAAVVNMVNEMLFKSEYQAPLAVLTGATDNFEIVIVTDNQIFPHIMVAGDTRALGNQRAFSVAQSLNQNARGKVFVSFRRRDRGDEISALDVGRTVIAPGVSAQFQTQQNGAQINKTTYFQLANSYMMLPIIGELTITGLETIFVS